MKVLMSVTVLSLVSSMAMANAAAPAPAAAAAAPASASATPSTSVKLRIQVDPFHKNLNNASKNYKTPKLDTFRVLFERDLGQYSKADLELRLNELENTAKFSSTEDGSRTLVNTDIIKYYKLLFKVPGVDGLEMGFVRELEPGLHGFTDKIKSSNIVKSYSFTGHMGRLEGYRMSYKLSDTEKITYHLSRNSNLDDNTYNDEQDKSSTWYHKLTTDGKWEDVAYQIGLGTQGQWLDLGTEKSKLKYSNFFHLLAETKMDEWKFKSGIAYDAYATVKRETKTAAENTAVTALIASSYEVLPKEFFAIVEFNYRQLKSANKDRRDFTEVETKLVDSSNEMAFTLAGQYKLDDKLSFIPSYNYFRSDRAQAHLDNNKGEVFEKDRTMLKGSDGKSAKFEQTLGLRIRYDY